MAIIDGIDLSLDQNLRKAPVVEPPTDQGIGDTFGAALLRGVDSAQAGTYAFAKTLSDAVGMDVVSKWAERGIERNLQEMMENPPEIRSWDDVNGLADFGTYVLEALGEQVPQLAMQFIGAKGGSALAKAQLGKAMKRKLGEQAYKNYLNQAAIKGSAEAQAMAKAARTGAIAGAMGLGTIQNVGETKMTLDDEGIADNSAQALLGGAIKGALDTIAFDRVMGLANRIGVPPDAVSDYLTKQAAKIGLGGAGTKLAVQVAKEGVTDAAVEGATEAAQTFVDQVLVHANKPNSDLFSSENIAELRESFIKGGILGGVVGGIETARLEFPDYMASRKRAQETAAQAISTLPTPSVEAQIGENPEVAVMPGPAVVPPVEEQEGDLRPDGVLVDDGDPTSVQSTRMSTRDVRFGTEEPAANLAQTTPVLDQTADGIRRAQEERAKSILAAYGEFDKAKAIPEDQRIPELTEPLDARLNKAQAPMAQSPELVDRPASYQSITPAPARVVQPSLPGREVPRTTTTETAPLPALSRNELADDIRLVVNSLPPLRRKQVENILQNGTPEAKSELFSVITEMARKARAEVQQTESVRKLGGAIPSAFDPARLDRGAAPEGMGVQVQTLQEGLTAEEAPAALQKAVSEQGMTDPSMPVDIDATRAEISNDEYQLAVDTLPDEQRARIKMGEPTLEDHYAVMERARAMRGAPSAVTQGMPAAVPVSQDDVRIIQAALPDELSPVPRTSKPSRLVAGADASTVERMVSAIWAARDNGQKRAASIEQFAIYDEEKDTFYPRKKNATPAEIGEADRKFKEMRDTLVYATDRGGRRVPLSTMDITTMGMDILAAEGVAQELSQSEFRRRGFVQGLSVLASVGYDVSDAVDTKTGLIKPEKLIYFDRLRKRGGERERFGTPLQQRADEAEYGMSDYDFDPYRIDEEVDPLAQADQLAQVQTRVAQDDNVQDATGAFRSTIETDLGNPSKRTAAVFPPTARLETAQLRVAELRRERERLEEQRDYLTAPGRPKNTLRERLAQRAEIESALKANQQAMAKAAAELDEATREDIRLATNREKPVAVRSRSTTRPPIRPLPDDGRRAAPTDLTDNTGASAARVPGYGSTPAAKSIFDTAPEIKTDSKDLRVFSNSPGVTRADAEFVAGLVEHFGQRQVTNVRIDESETLQRDDVRLGKDGDTLVIIVPTLPGKLSAPARQALMAEAIGMGLFNRYLHADPDLMGPDRSLAYRAALEKAYLQETRRKKVDPVAFRKWFGVKTAAYVKSLMATSKYTGATDKYGNPIDLRTTRTKNIPEEIQNRPAGLADKVFRELSARLANIWKAAEAKLKQYTPNYTVNKFLERVVRGDTTSIWWDTRKVDPAKAETPPGDTRTPPREKPTLRDKQRGQQPPSEPPSEPPSPPAPPASAAGEPPGPPQAFANIVGNSMDPAAWRGVRELFSAGSQLRAAWEPLGLLVEQPTNTLVENETTGREAYWTSVQTHRNMFTGSLNSILHKNFKGLDKGRIAVLESQAFKVLTMGTKDADFEAVRGGNIPAALQAFDPRAVQFAADLNALMQDVHAYQAKVNPKIRHTDGYFPRNYDLQAILSRKGEFDAILKKHDAEEVFDGMIEAFLRQQNNGEPLVPPAKHTRSRKITDQALVNDLVDAGFLNANPAVDMLKYLRNVVTRTEYDRLSSAIKAEFERFKGATLARVQTGELTAEQAKKEIARVQGLLNFALGLTPVDKSSAWYRPLEELRALTSLNSLLFGGIAGITEGGAILLKTRGMVEAKQFARITMSMFDKAERAELTEFAEAMGVITSDMQAALGSMMFENTDSFDGPISRYVPKMLEITGNEYMARMWRVVAVTTGKQYLLNLADVISQGRDKNGDARHQLRELSATLTPEMIYAWRDAGFPSMAMVSREDTPANRQLFSATQQAVHAIGRYVGETVVNPTPADTPPLARNMFGAFLFQLKAFDMTHKKRAIMGAYREIERQHAKGGISYAAASAAMWAAPAVMVLLLLSAIQEELRQRIRSMGEEGMIAGHNGDIGRIAKVLTDRAGFTSIPFVGAALNPTDIDTLAFEAGPTASKALQVGRDLNEGDPTAAVLHMIPGLSQIPAAREAVYKGLEEIGVRG